MEILPKKVKKRGSQACTFCNKRKIRCDGSDPCGECKLRKQRCLYSHNRIKRGPKKGKKWEHTIENTTPSTSHSPLTYDELGYSPVLSPSSISYLVTIFWHNIHPIWPIFARSGIDDILKLSYKEPLLFNAIIAITAKTQAHPSNDHNQSNEVYISRPNISQEQLTTLIDQIRKSVGNKRLPLRIQSIQIYILMALSELGGGAHDFAFHCSAQASLMSIEMDLHKNEKLSTSEKATFWCVYILDKMLAVMLGKPMLLRKSDISCQSKFIDQPPSEFKEGDSHLLIYQEYVNLLLILQDIIEEVYSHSACLTRSRSSDGLGESYLYSVKVIQHKLQEWKQDLPKWIEQQWQDNRSNDDFQSNNTFLLQSITLEAWYHACFLLLHRPLFGFQQEQGSIQYTTNNKEDQVQRGHKIVCQSATSITKSLRSYQKRNTARCIPSSWIFLTFLSAVIHITCLHEKTSLKRFIEPHKCCFDDCILLLCEISQTWKHAGKQVTNLYVINTQLVQSNRTNLQSNINISQDTVSTSTTGEVDIDVLWNDLLLSFEPGDAVLG